MGSDEVLQLEENNQSRRVILIDLPFLEEFVKLTGIFYNRHCILTAIITTPILN